MAGQHNELSGRKEKPTYNYCTFVAAFAFVLPFSLVHQMTLDTRAEFQDGRIFRPSQASLQVWQFPLQEICIMLSMHRLFRLSKFMDRLIRHIRIKSNIACRIRKPVAAHFLAL